MKRATRSPGRTVPDQLDIAPTPENTKDQVRFDPTYRLRMPPGYGTPAWENADREAAAFFAIWLADFDKETLEFVGSKLSAQALALVRFYRDELERGRIKTAIS